MSVLIRNAEVADHTGLDVRIDGTTITEVGRHLTWQRGDEVLDAGGGALLPGFQDHHIHLLGVAAARSSINVGPREVRDRAGLARLLRQASLAAPAGTWLRAVGYHESVAGMLDRHVLDGIVPDRPIRLQHRSGVLWVLNSVALERTGLAGSVAAGFERDEHGSPTGRLWHLDEWLRGAVPAEPDLAGALGRISIELAALGVTGFTDATPMRESDLAFLAATLEAAGVPQSVYAMSQPKLSPSDASGLALGPVKVRLDDAGLPGLHELADLIRLSHSEGRAVAIHCVGRVQCILALGALESAGTPPKGSGLRDRLEHATIVPHELMETARHLGLVIVSQPQMLCERGDRYLEDVDVDDLSALYPLHSLVSSGVPVAFGSDAPYGAADPWAAIRGAMNRQTDSGRTVGATERLGFHQALRGLLGWPDRPDLPRQIDRDAPADLVLLREPLEEVSRCPVPEAVAATIARGHLVYRCANR
jgi:predicted amidohydrolase YtcJ